MQHKITDDMMTHAQTGHDLAAMIDHTLLKPDALPQDIETLCREAVEWRFCSVCVNSCHVKACTAALADTDVKVCAVVGFPLGAMATSAKAFEASRAVADGAAEIDMVINIGLLKFGDTQAVAGDIQAVKAACGTAVLKVILETGLLTQEEKVTACNICKDLDVGFVKTSTGFGHGGATIEDVRLMRETVGPDIGVKASGGVKDMNTALEMVRAGASRLGTSSGVAIAKGTAEAGTSGAY